MIAKLKGILDALLTDYVILDVGGVGYRVFCSSKTMAKLAGVGHPAALFIETQVREVISICSDLPMPMSKMLLICL